jgi:hypothetical protein
LLTYGLINKTVREQACVPSEWPIKMRAFVPGKEIEPLKQRLPPFDREPIIENIEITLPWAYNRWPRKWPELAMP